MEEVFDQYEVDDHGHTSSPFVRLQEAGRWRKLGRDEEEVIRDEDEGRPDEGRPIGESTPHCCETVTGARGKTRARTRRCGSEARPWGQRFHLSHLLRLELVACTSARASTHGKPVLTV